MVGPLEDPDFFPPFPFFPPFEDPFFGAILLKFTFCKLKEKFIFIISFVLYVSETAKKAKKKLPP